MTHKSVCEVSEILDKDLLEDVNVVYQHDGNASLEGPEKIRFMFKMILNGRVEWMDEVENWMKEVENPRDGNDKRRM